MVQRSLSLLACLVLAILFSTLPAWSQEARGRILGRVTDSSGAVVPGVSIRLTHVATAVSRNLESNDLGNFTAPFLPTGIYQLTAEKQGFKRFVRDGIELRINDDLEINVSIDVGVVSESVTVTAETPLLETSNASLGQVVDSKRLSDLPMVMGLPYDLVRISPAVQFTQGNFRQDQPWEPGASVAYAMAGSDSKSAAITLDGADNTTRDEGGRTIIPNYVPPADAVEEMKVQTMTFDGSIGQTTGGLINVSLKSGTNKLHGTAYYSFIRTDLTANTFFGNKNNIPRPNSNVDRWGGVVSGPVILPKLYNGKNRTFFMYAYEGIHYASQRSTNYTVPTAEQRNGDFSGLLKIGSQYQIYDPFTRASIGGGRYQNGPFPGNIIPPSRISPIATKLMNTTDYPLPLNAGTTVDGSNNLPRPDATQYVKFYTHTFRLDHNFSEKHRMFLRLNKYKAQFDDPKFYGPDSIYSGTNFWYYMSGFAVDDVYTLSPTLVMNIKVSDSQYIRASDSNPKGRGVDLTQYGFPAYYNNSFDPAMRRVSSIGLSDYSGFSGASYSNLWQPSETRSATVALDKIKGGHGLKFGFEYKQYIKNRYNIGADAAGGTFNFDSSYTRGPLDNSPTSPRGQGLAAFLLGQPTGGTKTIVDSYAELSTLWAGYFQDDWKVNRKLTLNMSLRYEMEGPLTERFNRTVQSFQPNAPHSGNFDALTLAAYSASPIAERPPSNWSTKGGVQYAGVNGIPRELFIRDMNNFMPRIGYAYNLNTSTVIRGGYGLYFGPLGQRRQDVIQTNFNRTTNLVPTLDNGVTFVASLADPYPNGFLQPIGAGQGADTLLGLGLGNPSYFTQNLQASMTQKWQISIQRELPHRFVIELGYIGSHGGQVQTTRDLRFFPNQYLSRSPSRDQPVIDYWTGNVPNPFKGLVPGTSMNGSTITRDGLIRGFPQFTGLNAHSDEGANFYNAMQLRAERRFAQGFTFQFGYTWSKLMEEISFMHPDDARPEKVLSSVDFPHHIALSFIYELPLGRGRPFLSQGRPVTNAVLGGWQVSGIWSMQSGYTMGFGDAIYYGGNIADVVLPADQRTWSRWFDTSNFEKSVSKQLSYHYQVLSSRFGSIRGSRLNTWDLSALKNTRINEKMSFQFRTEFINALNQVWLDNPTTTPSSTSFGQITSERSVPRRIQMSMKLIF